MFLTNIDRAIVLYENKNTQSIKEFEVPFDQKRFAVIVEKILSIQEFLKNYEATKNLPVKCDKYYCIACKEPK
jgi:hypothetical protein